MTERRQVPMAFKAGGLASSLYAVEGFEDVNGQAGLAAAYITQLKEQAAQVLGSVVAASLVPVEYNGDFNWSWSDGSTGVNTPMNDGLAELEGATAIEIAERSAGNLLPGVPWIETQDVAELVLYLASDRARFATGAQFTLDAGLLTR